MPESKKHVIIWILFIIIIIMVIILFTPYYKPMKVIEKKLNLTFTSSAQIIHFNYDRLSEDLNAKILIDSQDVDNLRKSLLNYFGKEYIVQTNDDLPHNQFIFPWWDLDENEIEVCYMKIESGKRHWFLPSPKTVIFWAIISRQDDENYYLYLSR